jgi:hypothetical protein
MSGGQQDLGVLLDIGWALEAKTSRLVKTDRKKLRSIFTKHPIFGRVTKRPKMG